jgi:hypothetical protein
VVEIIELPTGFEVRASHFSDTFQCKANAVIAARILATGEAVLAAHDVGVLVPMGYGEVVRMDVMALA